MAEPGGGGKLSKEEMKEAIADYKQKKQGEPEKPKAEEKKANDAPKDTEKKDDSKDSKKEDKNGKSDNASQTPKTSSPSGGGYHENPQNPGDNVDYVERKPGEHREKVPFWRTLRNYFNGGRNAPKVETDFLDREKNYSKPEEIRALVENVLSYDFEINMRNKRFKELYGDGWTSGFKAFLAGDGKWIVNENDELELVGSDFTYTHGESEDAAGNIHETGTLQYSAANEFRRKLANVALKTGRTAIPAAILSVFTGGVGAAFMPALLGSGAARAITETVRSFTSEERQLKEKAEITRIRYFQKSRELARRIQAMPEQYDPDQTNKTKEQYEEDRKERVIDLLNFIYSYEELSTEVEFDERGRPVINTFTARTPGEVIDGKEPGPADDQFSARVKRTEVTQPSRVSPDAVKVKDLETELEKKRHNWDKISEYSALIGGLAAGAWYTLRGGWSEMTKTAYDQMQQKLNNGEIVNLNVDGNWKWHGVQKAGELAGRLHEQYMFHYKSIGEMLAAQAHGAHPIAEAGKYGVHALFGQGGDTAANLLKLNQAIYQQSIYQVSGQLAKVAAALGASSLIGLFNERGNSYHMEKYRHELKHNYEQRRIRNLPELTPEQMAAKENLVYPDTERFNFWVCEVSPGVTIRIKIIEIQNNNIIAVRDDPNSEFNEVIKMSIPELWEKWHPVMPAEKKTSAPGDTGKQGATTTEGGVSGGQGSEKKNEGETTEPQVETNKRQEGHYSLVWGNYEKEKASSHEFVFNEKVRGNQELLIAVNHKNENANLPDPALLEQITHQIASKYDSLKQVGPNEITSQLEEIAKQVLNDLISDEALRNQIGLTLAVTLEDGRYYGICVNNTEARDDKNDQLQRIMALDENGEYRKGWTNKEHTQFNGILQNGDKLVLLSKLLSSISSEHRKAIFAGNDLDKQVRDVIEQRLNFQPVPAELRAIIAQYTKNAKLEVPKGKFDDTEIATETEESKEEEAEKLIFNVPVGPEGKIEKIELKEGYIFYFENDKNDPVLFEIKFADPSEKTDAKIKVLAYGLGKDKKPLRLPDADQAYSPHRFRLFLETSGAKFTAPELAKVNREKIENLEKKTPETRELSPEESESIFSRLELNSAIDLDGKKLSKEILQNYDLLPKYEMEINGQRLWTSSKKFNYRSSGSHDRSAGIAYFDNGENKSITSLPYLASSSQGIFRFYPGFVVKNGGIDWFSKGTSEEALMLPHELQKAVSQIEISTSTIDEETAELILVGCSNKYEGITDVDTIKDEDKKYIESKIQNFRANIQRLIESGADKVKIDEFKKQSLKNLERSLASAKGAELLGLDPNPTLIDGINTNGILDFSPDDGPEKIDFTNKEERPNFDKIIDSWQREDTIYGKVTYEIFDSINNKFEFTMCRDTRGRAWVGGVELKDAKINKWGLKTSWIDTGALTTPGFEYKKQLITPDGRKYYPHTDEAEAINENSYIDAYQEFLAKIPVIKEYQEAIKNRT